MKTFLTSAAAACLILFAGASAQGELLNVTTLYVPGAIDTEAYGIDGGNIVGSYYDSSYNAHGFSYDGSTYTTLDVLGASRTYAYGIDGSNIVGQYYDGSGTHHGFLAVIPEPTTLSLLAVGVLMVCRRRR